MEILPVFNFTDPMLYLQAALDAKKSRNSSYSLRSWARDLDIKEPTVLSQILKRKRHIPNHYIPVFAKNLKLNEKETEYFEAIIELSQTKIESEKILWTKKAFELSLEASYIVHELQDLRLLESPLHMTILSLVHLRDFVECEEWIAAKLLFKYPKEQIKNSINSLLDKNLLKRSLDGSLTRTDKHVASKQDSVSLWIKKFHETSLIESIEALYTQPLSDREFGSYIFSIHEKALPDIKLKIRKFISDTLAEFTVLDGTADSVYQLNLNCIRKTNRTSHEIH